jgi:hypothetical protein
MAKSPVQRKESPEEARVRRTDSVEAAILNPRPVIHLLPSTSYYGWSPCLNQFSIDVSWKHLASAFAIFAESSIDCQMLRW